MLEKEPVYFADFRKSINLMLVSMEKKFDKMDDRFEKIDDRFDKMDDRFDKMEEKLDEVVKNQETHFEAIGELKVQVTGIETLLKKKADISEMHDLEKRTHKIEKVVFA